MAKPKTNFARFAIFALLAYFVYRNWPALKSQLPASLQSALSPSASATPGLTSHESVFGMNDFGGSNATTPGFAAVGYPIPGPANLRDPGGFTGFIGSGGGAIDFGYTAAGNPLTGPVANSFGPGCSTHLTDGKPLCA